MTDDFELVRGSANIYRDFGPPDAGLEQARALVAAAIIRNLDARKLSTRDAEKLTGSRPGGRNDGGGRVGSAAMTPRPGGPDPAWRRRRTGSQSSGRVDLA